MAFFGIGEGPSGHEIQQSNLLGAASDFATGLGEGNLSLSSGFFRDLLQDPMKALAPEVSASQKMVQNQAKTGAEFGTRSGGTTAANRAASDTARGDIINLMGKTQTGAAGELSSSGQNLLSTGISGTEQNFNEQQIMHDQSASQIGDLIKGILSTVGGGVSGLQNLDKTGGSTGMEQVMNFLSGANQ